MAWRQNLNEGINDLIDATKTSKWDKYYNIIKFKNFKPNGQITADLLNNIEKEISQHNWDINQSGQTGYKNFNELFNKTGYNDFFGYNEDVNDYFGPSTYNRKLTYDQLKNTYNSIQNSLNGVYWDKDKWVQVNPEIVTNTNPTQQTKIPVTNPSTTYSFNTKGQYDFNLSPFQNYLKNNPYTINSNIPTPDKTGNPSNVDENNNSIGTTTNLEEINKFIRSIFTQPQKTLSQKINEQIPLGSNIARLFSSILYNKKNAKILKEGLTPVLQNTYERFSPVTGAFGVRQQASQQAANLRSKYSKPITSDASLYTATQLEAQRQADNLVNQANLQDWQEIKRTRAEALARQEDNMARRTQIANNNLKELANYRQDLAEIDAAKNIKNSNSISEFISGIGQYAKDQADKQQAELDKKKNILFNAQLQNESDQFQFYYKQMIDQFNQWKINNNKPKASLIDWPGYSKYKDYLQTLQRIKANNTLYYSALWNNITDPNLNYIEPIVPSFQKNGGVIRKFGYGGRTANYFSTFKYQPFISQQQPVIQSSGEKTTSKTEEKDPKEEYIKNLVGSIKELKGLTSDSNYVTSYILKTMNKWQYDDTLTTYDMANDAIKIQNLINRCVNDKAQYDESYKLANQREAMSDVAITNRGTIVVKSTDGKLTNMSIESYLKNQDKYIPVSNEELASIRENYIPFNDSFNGVLNNAASAKTFDEYISKTISTLGSTSVTDSGPSQDIINGLNSLSNLTEEQQQAVIESLQNGYIDTKVVSKDSARQIEAALAYILYSMPKNLKTWAAFKLGISDENAAVKTLAALKLSSRASLTTALDNMVKNGRRSNSGSGSNRGSSGSEQKYGYWTTAQKELSGDLNKNIQIRLGQGEISVYGTKLANNEGISGNMSLDTYLSKSRGSEALDTSRISIGGIRIDPNEANKILLQSNYQVTVLTLPSKSDGTPYIEILDEYNKVLDALKKYKNELKSNGYTESNPNYQTLVNNKLQELIEGNQELRLAFDNKLGDSATLKQYVALRGVVPENISTIQSNGEIVELNNVKNKDLSVYKASQSDKDSYKYVLKTDDKGHNIESMDDYEGDYVTTIFIPFNDQNANTTILADRKDLKQSDAYQNAGYELQFNYNSTSMNQ